MAGTVDIARQLIRAIRGKRSQEALSRRLGYTSNPVADWEAGRRFPTAAETLRACVVTGIDVPAAFARFRTQEAPALGAADDLGVAAWLRALQGTTPILEVSARVGQSRHRVGRWLAGHTRPRLPDFLALVEALTGRLSDLLAELVDIEAIGALADRHRAKQASRRLAFDEPWTEGVLRVIETEAYRSEKAHRPGWIARRLGIGQEVEARCLERLESAGVVTWEGRRYATAEPLTVDTRAGPQAVLAVKSHWARVGLERLRQPHASDQFSYNVLSVSRADLDRIRAMHLAYFRELRSVVAASEPVEVAALVNIQLLAFDEPD